MTSTPSWSEDELNAAWDDLLEEDGKGPFAEGDPRSAISALRAADLDTEPDPLFVARTRALVTGGLERKRTHVRPKSHQLGLVYAPRPTFQLPSLMRYAIAAAVALLVIWWLSFGTIVFDGSSNHSAIASVIATTTPGGPTPIPTMIGSSVATE
jgi:hypothetical protein